MEYRYLYDKIERHLSHKNITLITGARQVGKTSILKKLREELIRKGEDVHFLNLEDKDVLRSLNKDAKAAFTESLFVPQKILIGKAEKRVFLLVDEIQYLDDPSNFLKFIYDEYEDNVKLVVTGSSAFYIDKIFKDSLAGRKRIFHLYPLSFNEFLVFKRQEKINNEISNMVSEPSYYNSYRADTRSLLFEYMTYGGYPAVVLEDNKDEKEYLLGELKNSYVRRDIIESGVDKEQKFFMLIQLLSDQIGNIVNKNELSNTLGLDNKTVERYTYILEKCFHITLVKPYFSNFRKELTKMPKVFFNDLGLRNAVLSRFGHPEHRADKGALLENFIYNQLRIKHDEYNMKYWRTSAGHEVDFIIEESYEKGYALEVKWKCSNMKLNKYKKFKELYPNFPLSCIDSMNAKILQY